MLLNIFFIFRSCNSHLAKFLKRFIVKVCQEVVCFELLQNNLNQSYVKFRYSLSNFYHKTTIDIRFRDLDPLNHVNNAVFNTYFEEARIRFIQTVPELKSSMELGFSFVLAHLDLKYVKPVFYHEKLVIGSSLKSIGNTSVTGIQALYNQDEKLKAIAETTGVWYDVGKKRPAKLPEMKNNEQYFLNDSDG